MLNIPDTTNPEDLRNFQLDEVCRLISELMIDSGATRPKDELMKDVYKGIIKSDSVDYVVARLGIFKLLKYSAKKQKKIGNEKPVYDIWIELNEEWDKKMNDLRESIKNPKPEADYTPPWEYE